MIHRDLKPENIMLTRRAGRRALVHQSQDARGKTAEHVEPEVTFDFVTLLDFGAAKICRPSHLPARQSPSSTVQRPIPHNVPQNVDLPGGVLGGEQDMTRDNIPETIMGTPAYMALKQPEQDRPMPGRMSMHSNHFYEMLTGRLPFNADEPVDIMRAQIQDQVLPPRLANPNVEITREAERLIMKAEKDPASRFQTMAEMNDALQRCYGAVRFVRDPSVAGAAIDVLPWTPGFRFP